MLEQLVGDILRGRVLAETAVASASTCDIGAALTTRVEITGTTTITSFGTVANRRRRIRFSGVLTLTHNVTTLILPTGANITTAAGDVCEAESDGSGNWRVTSYQRVSGTALAVSPGTSPAPDVIVEDQKAANTEGGTFTSGARATRVLNTLVRNVASLASLSANAVTLPAGTYRFRWSAPAFSVDAHKTWLRNTTDSTDAGVGVQAFSISTGSGWSISEGSAVVTIAGSKTFTIEHRCQTSKASNGLGTASNFGSVEIFARLEIWKL